MESTSPKIKCIIVDDEPLAIKLIKSHVKKVDTLEIIAECRNALQAMDVLRKSNIDLMFLDIHMPQISGLDFLKILSHPPKVILTTAYRQYALEGFDLDVVDYLLKPISLERFLKAVNRYYERIEKSTGNIVVSRETPAEEPLIYIRDNKKVFKVYLKDISYIEGYGEYIKIHAEDKTYLTRKTMHEFEKKLPYDQFLRIHKSYIVSIPKISAFTSLTVHIMGIELPIGRSVKDTVWKKLLKDSNDGR